MPEQVMSAMAKYLEESNSGLIRWFKAPAIYVLKTLAMPATVPCDIVYATLTKWVILVFNFRVCVCVRVCLSLICSF